MFAQTRHAGKAESSEHALSPLGSSNDSTLPCYNLSPPPATSSPSFDDHHQPGTSYRDEPRAHIYRLNTKGAPFHNVHIRTYWSDDTGDGFDLIFDFERERAMY